MRGLGTIIFGGCNVRNPLYRAPRPKNSENVLSADKHEPTFVQIVGPHFMTYTVGEAIQTLECWRGNKQIPEEIYNLCPFEGQKAPSPLDNPLGGCELVLVEPNTSIEINFNGYSLNRWPVARLISSVASLNPMVKKLSSLWFRKGIMAQDETARRDLTEKLISALPKDTPNRAMLTEFFRGARGNQRDMTDGFRRLSDALDVPMGIVAFTWSYMPDGRPLSWPDGFHGEVVAAAKTLGIPIFDPRSLVTQAGLTHALKEDMRHYRDEFMPVVADHLLEFARSVASGDVKMRN